MTSHNTTTAEMETPTPLDKSKDQRFHNWVKFNMILYYVKSGLCLFVQKELKCMHQNLVEKIYKVKDVSGKQPCTTCDGRCVKRDKIKCWYFSPPCTLLCDVWFRELLELNHSRNSSNIDWTTIDIPKLPFEPWECAKTFIPRPMDVSSKGPDKCDVQALLKILANCKYFREKLSDNGKRLALTISDIRNMVMHHPELELSDEELKTYAKHVIQFLEDPVLISEEECIAAINKIKKVLELPTVYPLDENLREFFQEITEKQELFQQITERQDAVQEKLDSVSGKLLDAVQETFESVSSKLMDTVQETLESVSSKLMDAVQEKLESVSSKHMELLQDVTETQDKVREMLHRVLDKKLKPDDEERPENRRNIGRTDESHKDVDDDEDDNDDDEDDNDDDDDDDPSDRCDDKGAIGFSTHSKARNRDTRGIRRGECKGCIACPEFIGDMKCEYCSCAAAKHVILTPSSLDIGDSDSFSEGPAKETLRRARNHDTRGIRRGECKGCTGCLEFIGDMKCEYCSCAAAKHIILTPSSLDVGDSNMYSDGQAKETLRRARNHDTRGIRRGECKGCTGCPEFIGDMKCEYCSCAAAKHVILTPSSLDMDDSNSYSEGPAKEALRRARNRDTRGIRRGECKGCTGCPEFIGDMKCEYCSCAAAKHVILTPSSLDVGDYNNSSEGQAKDTLQTATFYAEKIKQQKADLKEVSKNIQPELASLYAERIKQQEAESKVLIKRQMAAALKELGKNNQRALEASLYAEKINQQEADIKELGKNNQWALGNSDFLYSRYYELTIDEPNASQETRRQLELEFNNAIKDTKNMIREHLRGSCNAEFKDARIENGSIIILISMDQQHELNQETLPQVYNRTIIFLVQKLFPSTFNDSSQVRIKWKDITKNITS